MRILIELTDGVVFDRKYVLRLTTAPKVYDMASTLTLQEHDGARTVAIEVDQLKWHEGRYGSGMHSCVAVEQLSTCWFDILQRMVDQLKGLKNEV